MSMKEKLAKEILAKIQGKMASQAPNVGQGNLPPTLGSILQDATVSEFSVTNDPNTIESWLGIQPPQNFSEEGFYVPDPVNDEILAEWRIDQQYQLKKQKQIVDVKNKWLEDLDVVEAGQGEPQWQEVEKDIWRRTDAQGTEQYYNARTGRYETIPKWYLPYLVISPYALNEPVTRGLPFWTNPLITSIKTGVTTVLECLIKGGCGGNEPVPEPPADEPETEEGVTMHSTFGSPPECIKRIKGPGGIIIEIDICRDAIVKIQT